MTAPLPVDAALPALRAALAAGNRAILSAPPGAGKTTRAPLALADEPWATGRILLLEPRRIAARMAAERMARETGTPLGGLIGLSTRVDRKVSRDTRIEVITDGLFTRRILSDPALSGASAVIFDEFHERSLAADLGLALALDAQGALREDLRIVVMSATLDTARVSALLGAPTIESEGRRFPVETHYMGRTEERLEDQVARAVSRAMRETGGSLLVFLPGRAEIDRAAARLAASRQDATIAPLHGGLSPREQDAAVAPPRPGERRIILATDIAESALTIEGVCAVIDAGLSRVAEFDPATGAMRLETRRAARASVDQRRGRAGRTGPGACYRLWDEATTRGLPAAPAPEIETADLSPLALALAEWGERDASRLAFLDPPPAGRLEAARAGLAEAGAMDASGALTARGRIVAALPLPPALAAMIAGARTPQDAMLAAEIAALVSERGLGGDALDIRIRIERWRADDGPRAHAMREAARRWAKIAVGGDPRQGAHPARAGVVIAGALPRRMARRKSPGRGHFLTAGGRAVFVDERDALASAEWIAVADMVSAGAAARVLAAAPLAEDEALAIGPVETRESAEIDAAARRIRSRRIVCIGAVVLSETPLPQPSGDAARAAVIDAIRAKGLDISGGAGAARRTLARIAFARAHGLDAPPLDEAALIARIEEWYPAGRDAAALLDPAPADVARAVFSLLGCDAARRVDALAPVSIAAPSGRALAIDYLNPAGPAVEARVQEFYGAARHPRIAGGAAPLAVSLLSPAGRQVALTKDLPAFWSGGYRDMAKDMRGRYPKHDWPADPAGARPHEGRTKKRL